LSYLFGLGLSPEARTVFASGALLVVAAAYGLDRLPIRLTPLRLVTFAGFVTLAWLAASFDLQTTNELAVRDELLVLILVAALVAFSGIRRTPAAVSRVAILLTALVPTAVVWGLFNPLQSTTVMFRKPDTAVTQELDLLASQRPDRAIAVDGFWGAVLNGVGYRSVTHVLTVPSPELFRVYFPDMDERRFDHVFNRYAQIALTERAEPYVQNMDIVRLPIRTMGQHATTRSD
jgi:hypothetical protein